MRRLLGRLGRRLLLGGHPVLPEHGPGPIEALDEWYPTQSDFVIDRSRERFMLSLNPRGFLKRVS